MSAVGELREQEDDLLIPPPQRREAEKEIEQNLNPKQF